MSASRFSTVAEAEHVADTPRFANHSLTKSDAEALYQLAVTDSLTGCYNRRFFEDVIDRELERHRRYGIPLSVLFVDVDRFKAVNDSLGHEAGDRVLRSIADFLKQHVRRSDYVFRWGGDEFLILIWGNEHQAIQMRVELKAVFEAAKETSALPRSIGLSIGCAEVEPDTTDIAAVIRDADQRMYEDKRAARE